MCTCKDASLRMRKSVQLRNLPFCLLISISLKATLAAPRAPSITASGEPTKVYTVLLVESPGATSSSEQPSTARTASAIASTTACRRPSEKFGTHSTIFAILSYSSERRSLIRMRTSVFAPRTLNRYHMVGVV